MDQKIDLEFPLKKDEKHKGNENTNFFISFLS